VLIISGVINQDEIDDLLNSGAEDFLRKPFSIEDLLEKISNILQLV